MWQYPPPPCPVPCHFLGTHVWLPPMPSSWKWGGGAVASVLGVLGRPRKALPAFRPGNCQPAGASASRSKILRCPACRSFPSLSELKLRLSQWALHKQPIPAAFTTTPWAGQFLARLSVSCAGHTERTALAHWDTQGSRPLCCTLPAPMCFGLPFLLVLLRCF